MDWTHTEWSPETPGTSSRPIEGPIRLTWRLNSLRSNLGNSTSSSQPWDARVSCVVWWSIVTSNPQLAMAVFCWFHLPSIASKTHKPISQTGYRRSRRVRHESNGACEFRRDSTSWLGPRISWLTRACLGSGSKSSTRMESVRANRTALQWAGQLMGQSINGPVKARIVSRPGCYSDWPTR